ncbi:MAG: DUF962 domain-containing protein [Ignavibacteriales bacterium CG12_big_fil_rev_8_21_14_0_65_30_8]|nr:MAG: DUF962 domain-containing protein [Ignavibacteriales bacterium CG12_big_fil_rev_8_21_14_0_65_30_8]
MKKNFNSFQDFYVHYLSEHKNRTCRTLHFIGTTLVLTFLLAAIFYGTLLNWVLVPIAGYGLAWIGHFFFEKNKPATFSYPIWSLISDFKLFFEILLGTKSLDTSKD